MRRRLIALAGFATGALVGSAAYRRWVGGSRERLDLYFDDGSFVTLADGSAEAERLLPLARQVLTAARPK
jgi:hypothetical protein